MTVAELIAVLRDMPQDRQIGYVYDGYLSSIVSNVWVPRADHKPIALGDERCLVYVDDEAPVNAKRHPIFGWVVD